MDYTTIINAVLVLGILGAVFGLLLAIASKVFAVDSDPRLELVLNALPGANCGGCGFAGCSAYATAVTEGTAEVGACPVGGAGVSEAIAGIMGIQVTKNERWVAQVKCRGGVNSERKANYEGLTDCLAAMKVSGNGPLECAYGCLGYGTCVAACPFDAIRLHDGVARVDHDKCTGCMSCVNACPRHIIVKAPYEADILVACSSKEKGAALRKTCNIGCLGCKICEKTCENDAIHIIDNLAVIDYEKCDSCSACAEKCPRHLIADANLKTEFNIVESRSR